MNEYSQGVCEDGAAILKNGQPMTVEEIIQSLQELEKVKAGLDQSQRHISLLVMDKEATRNQRDGVSIALGNLMEVCSAAFDWIDNVPSDTELPAMPGFDRDWADEVRKRCRNIAGRKALMLEHDAVVLEKAIEHATYPANWRHAA